MKKEFIKITILACFVMFFTNIQAQTLVTKSKSSSIVRYDGSLRLCPGDTIRLTGKSAAGNEYCWEVYDNLSKLFHTLQSSNTDSILAVMFPGSFRLRITDKLNKNYYSDTFNISFGPYNHPYLFTNNGQILCKNHSIMIKADSLPTNTTIKWYKDESIIKGATSTTYTATTSGTYHIEIPDSCGIAKSNSIVIFNDSTAQVKIVANGNTIFCPGGSVLLSPKITDNIKITEDLETGDLSKFNWKENGPGWTVHQDTVSSGKYALSTSIIYENSVSYDSPTARISTSLYYPQSDIISFDYKININSNYNTLLCFYINDQRLAYLDKYSSNFNSEWIRLSYTVPKGLNTFRWEYNISYSNNKTFYNRVWLDNIEFRKYTKWNYQWYKDGSPVNGATEYTYAAKNQGFYYLKINNGCSDYYSQAIEVKHYTPPDTTITCIIDTANHCRRGAATLNAVNKSSYRYKWSKNGKNVTGGSSSSLYVNSSGNYSVIITDLNSCSSTAKKTINIIPKIKPKIKANALTANCKDTTTISSMHIQQDYKYNWKLNNIDIAGATNSSHIADLSGLYKLYISDDSGCKESSDSVFIELHPRKPSIISPNKDTLLCSSSESIMLYTNGSFKDNFESGKLDYKTPGVKWGCEIPHWNYCWQPTNSTAHSGSYSLLSGCRDGYSDLYLKFNIPLPEVVSFYYKTKTSPGSDLNFWVLFSGVGHIFLDTTSVWTKISFITGFSLYNNSSITWIARGSIASALDGMYIDDVEVGSLYNPKYQWRKDGKDIAGATNASYEAVDRGFYTVVITDSCGTIESNPYKIKKSNGVQTSITAVDTNISVCLKGAKILKALKNDYYKYYWSANSIVIPNTDSTSVLAAKSGNYYYYAYDSLHCYASSSINISVVPADNYKASITPSTEVTICEDKSIILDATSTNAIVYKWYKQLGKSFNEINGANQAKLIVNQAGVYKAKIDFTNNCKDSTTNVKINTRKLPDKSIELNKAGDYCISGKSLLYKTYPFSEGFESGSIDTNIWKNDKNNPWGTYNYGAYLGKYCAESGYINNNQKTSELSFVSNLKSPDSLNFYFKLYGLYVDFIVKANDSILGTYSNKDKQTYYYWTKISYLLKAGKNKISFITKSDSLTQDYAYSSIDAINIGNSYTYNYQWLKNGGNISGSTTNYYYVSDEGKYTLAEQNNCGQTISAPVNILKFDKAVITPSSTITTCGDTTVTLYANNASGIQYQWQKNSTNIAGASDSQYSLLNTQYDYGSYRVIETNTNSCADTSKSTKVNYFSLPSVNIKKDSSICADSVYIVNAAAGNGKFTYLWSTGETTASIKLDSTGVGSGTKHFYVIVTDSNNCSVIADGNITFDICSAISRAFNYVGLNIFPNPSDGLINLQFFNQNSKKEELTMTIFNSQTQRVYDENLSLSTNNFTKTLNLKTLSKGLYIMQLKNNNNCITRKIIIQ